MIISTHWLSPWINVKQICKVLRAVRLFEPDRNEEKWTNEHVYWEQRMSNFFINEPITFKWKHKASCRENKQTSDLSGNFVILWLVKWNSLHLSLRFDHLRLLHGTVFCLDMFRDCKAIRWVNTVEIAWQNKWFFLGRFFFFFFRSQRSGSSGTAKKTIITQIVVP